MFIYFVILSATQKNIQKNAKICQKCLKVNKYAVSWKVLCIFLQHFSTKYNICVYFPTWISILYSGKDLTVTLYFHYYFVSIFKPISLFTTPRDWFKFELLLIKFTSNNKGYLFSYFLWLCYKGMKTYAQFEVGHACSSY